MAPCPATCKGQRSHQSSSWSFYYLCRLRSKASSSRSLRETALTPFPPSIRRNSRLDRKTHLQQHLHPLSGTSHQRRRNSTEESSERQLSQAQLSLLNLLRCRVRRPRRRDLLSEVERPEREGEDGSDSDDWRSHTSVESVKMVRIEVKEERGEVSSRKQKRDAIGESSGIKESEETYPRTPSRARVFLTTSRPPVYVPGGAV